MRSLRGNIEADFLRPLYLGESIAPFRALNPILAVIPWYEEKKALIETNEAQSLGYINLAKWLVEAEQRWKEHGSGRRTLKEQLDYYGRLTAQFPISPLRVVYSKAGTLPAATIVSDQTGLVDHTLYWTSIRSLGEGYYLLSILNSETARKSAEGLQARGQWGSSSF